MALPDPQPLAASTGEDSTKSGTSAAPVAQASVVASHRDRRDRTLL
jgi:hypothetical protein